MLPLGLRQPAAVLVPAACCKTARRESLLDSELSFGSMLRNENVILG
jgi:hypothetical protein